ncbi:MAG: hypothetical protein EXR95_02335 [Gemmatimonadetes bacterium]|nr:hypothetical protein [Gemmatimonadota bacterium]
MRLIPRARARRLGRSTGLAAAVLAFAGAAQAQQAKSGGNNVPAGIPARPLPVARPGVKVGDIRIDGRIEEAAWDAAPPITEFVQSEPFEGQPAVHKTDVRVLFDDDAMYVAARMYDHPDSVRTLLSRRDEGGPLFDWVGVGIDPGLTRRNGYSIRVNASGVQQDIYVYDDAVQDREWNAVYDSKVTIDSLGWAAEFRIPLSQIRYTASDQPQTWGFNFQRRRLASGELVSFALQSRRRGGGAGGGGGGGGNVIVSQMGMLENVVVRSSGRRIEARPYLLSSYHGGPAEAGDPFFDGSETRLRVGSDFRFGLGSSFTFDATVNPDFGQVDADPAVINLSAFETFFDERRPFFVEDASVFDFRLSGGQNQLFYSRRIGRSPHLGAPSGVDFAEIPDAATILGATKLTGRTPGGFSIGALTALTQAESGQGFSRTGGMSEFEVEPRTEYAALSARQEVNEGRSQVSAIFTALHRGLPEGGTFAALTDQAYNGGVRFEHAWPARVWRLSGFLATGHVRGSPAALTAIQRASNHYFQRPDATGSRVDSSATSMSGREWRLQLDRLNASWTGGMWLAEVSDGFEINDLGFGNSRERLDGGLRVGYLQIEPGQILRDFNVNFNTFYNFSHEALDDAGSWDSWRRAYVNGNFTLGSSFTLLNYHGGGMNVSWQPDRFSRAATRGGPMMIEPGSLSGRVSVNSDRRRPYSASVGFDAARGARGSGDDWSVNGSVTLRPSSPIQIEIQPSYGVQSDDVQYVTSTGVQSYAPTFGRRYFFADLRQKTASLEGRMNLGFSPTLMFQLYTQGLLSSGDYQRYKQLATPGTYDFRTFQEGTMQTVGGRVACAGGSICRDGSGTQYLDIDGDAVTDYSFSDRDFNVRSLIGNAVLRWEYRPGSTIFLVWQRQQEGEARVGDFRFGRDLDALWDAPPTDRFIVKVNYWLGI